MNNAETLSQDVGEDRNALAARLAALSHPARLAILDHLARADNACCCKDVVGSLDLAQSTVSQHLKVLVDAGLVRYRPDRQRSIYEIDRDALSGLSQAIDRLLSTCCTAPEVSAPAARASGGAA